MPDAARAVNIRREPHDTYVGRPSMRDRRTGPIRIVNLRLQAHSRTASKAELDDLTAGVGKWGNPWERKYTPDPIGSYRRYINYRIAVGHITLDDIRRDLVGKRLGCFCKPEPCHADILADLANSMSVPTGETPAVRQAPLI